MAATTIQPLNDASKRLASDPAMIRYARRLSRYWARRYGVDLDEAESAGLFALVKTASRFDEELGDFSDLLSVKVRWEIHRQMTSEIERNKKVSVGIENLGRDGLLAFHDESAETVDQADAIRHLVRNLPAKHRDLVLSYYVESSTRGNRKKVAERFGILPDTVSTYVRQGIGMILEELGRSPWLVRPSIL